MAVQEANWSFEPVDLQALPGETAPFTAVSPAVKAVGAAATLLSFRDTEFVPVDAQGYWSRSVLLHTPQGPVHYYRVANDFHDSGELAVEYPKDAGPIPADLIADTLGVESAELHNDFPYTGSATAERKLVSTLRFPGTRESGGHHWIEERDGTIVHFGGPHLSGDAVMDGRLGRVHVPSLHSVALAKGWYHGYVEEQPKQVDANTVRGLEDRFKRLAVNIGHSLGGVTQLSAVTQETSPMLLSFHAMGTHHGQGAKLVAAKLTGRGYSDVSISQRVPGENADPGFKVVVGHRATPQGRETLAAYEGLSTFQYTRGARQWRLVRGVVLSDAVTVGDIDDMLKPLHKSRRR